MPVLPLLYYSSCYVIAVACALFAFVRRAMVVGGVFAPDEARPSRDTRFAIFLSFLALGTVGMANGYFQAGGLHPDLTAIAAFNGLSLLGMAGSIFATPFFASSFSRAGKTPPKDGARRQPLPPVVKAFAALAAAGAVFIPFLLGYPSIPEGWRNALAVILASSFAASMVWSIARVALALRALRENAGASIESWRWHRTLKAIAILGAVLCPLAVANDYFQLPVVLWGTRLPDVLPATAVSLGLVYLYFSLAANRRLQRSFTERSGQAELAAAPDSGKEPGWPNAGLTPRETEVARLLVSGYTYRAIAERLGIGAATVKTHILKVYDKTGAGNKLELYLFSDARQPGVSA